MAAGSRPVPLTRFVALRSISRSPRKTWTPFITVNSVPKGLILWCPGPEPHLLRQSG